MAGRVRVLLLERANGHHPGHPAPGRVQVGRAQDIGHGVTESGRCLGKAEDHGPERSGSASLQRGQIGQ